MAAFEISETIGYLLIQIFRSHRSALQVALADHELHPGQELLLLQLGEQDGLTQSELVLRLQIQPPTLTRMLNRMVSTGIIERKPDPGDRRISRVYLTPTGRKLQKPILDIWIELENSILAKLTPDQKSILQNLLQRVYLNSL